MTTSQPLPLTVSHKPSKWITVLIANIVLLAAGVLIVVAAIMQWGEWGWKAILLAIVGVLVALLGLGNATGARRKFAPTDMVAAGVDVDGFILPAHGLVPWSAFTSIDFAYTLSGGSKMILNLIYGMDDRKVVVRLAPEALAPDLRADIEKHSPEAFGEEGMELAFVTGLIGGTNSYIELLHATENAAPQGFPLTVTSKDSSFLKKLDKARAAA